MDAHIDFSKERKLAWFRFPANGRGLCLKNYSQFSEREGYKKRLLLWNGWNIVYMEKWE
jgi:hypothetical protein